MEQTAFYYDGSNARATLVMVQVLDRQLYLSNEDGQPVASHSLQQSTYNQAGNNHFLYFDAAGTRYLQIEDENPLSRLLKQATEAAQEGWGQRLMRQKLLVLLPLMLALAVGLYFLVLALVPAIGMSMITKSTEIAMGNKLKDVLLQQAVVMGQEIDSQGTQKLQAFGNALRLSKDYKLQFTLVRSGVVNAYALPGGQVVVYTGLLEKLETPEALAALLGHESTHINQRHSLRSLLRSAANGLVVSVIFGDATGLSGALVSNAENLNGLQYSRSLEREADAEGMALLIENGLSASGMVQLMEALNEEDRLPEKLGFLSSHPLTKERVAAAKKYAQTHKKKTTGNRKLEAAFKALKETEL